MSLAAAKFRFAVCVLGFVQVAAATTITALPPIWSTAPEAAITSWTSGNADDGWTTFNLPFLFPLFGTDYSSVVVSSNGWLTFGGVPGNGEPQASQPMATVAAMMSGFPIIAPAWYSIVPTATTPNGEILTTLLTSQGTSAGTTEAVFTWQGVASYMPQGGQSVPQSNLATFQVILSSNGDVTFAYQSLNALAGTGVTNSLVGSPQAIVGISEAEGDTAPASINLSGGATSSGLNFSTSTNTTNTETIYQVINNNPADGSNFAGLDLLFTPQEVSQGNNVTWAWQVNSEYNPDGTTSQGTIPEPATVAEISLGVVALMVLWRRKSTKKQSFGGTN